MQAYKEKEQVKGKEIQNLHFEEKKSTRKIGVASKACAKREGIIIKEINVKKRPTLQWNKGKGTLRARPYPACINELKVFSSLQKQLNKSNMIQEAQSPSEDGSQAWQWCPHGAFFRVMEDSKMKGYRIFLCIFKRVHNTK